MSPEKNPYLDRVAIRDTARFFGRRREVARIFSRLGAARPQSISVVGERRIGKSSMLHYVADAGVRSRMLEDPGKYVFVLLDFQQRRTIRLEEFFRELLGSILEAEAISRKVEPDYDGLRSAVSSLHRQGRKLVILFDEFEAVTANPAFGEDFFAFFRSLANNYDLAYITSSRLDLQELCHTSRIADSPFFNIFTTLNLGTFTRDEALELIALPSEAAGFSLSPWAGRILELSGHFPFFLQVACAAFWDSRTPEDDVDCTQADDLFLEEAEPHFRYLWDHFGPEERQVLYSILAGEAPAPGLAFALRRLERGGYVRAGGMSGLFSRAFGDFLNQRIAREMVADTEVISPPAPVVPTARSVRPGIHEGGTLGTFLLEFRVGEGGMGVVYQAIDTVLGRKVAIKILPPHLAESADIRRRFLEEARTASALNHPNVCTLYQVGQSPEGDYLVMEFIEGKTFRELIPAAPMEPMEVARLGAQAAAALAHAHSRGLVHRDIKPANIMLTPEGVVKVLDFGLAKRTEASQQANLSTPGALVGTVRYMSPEQLRGEEVDARTDLFSLGLVLWELATGNHPFSGSSSMGLLHGILFGRPDPLPGEIPPFLADIFLRVLEKNPGDRLQTAAEMERLLKLHS